MTEREGREEQAEHFTAALPAPNGRIPSTVGCQLPGGGGVAPRRCALSALSLFACSVSVSNRYSGILPPGQAEFAWTKRADPVDARQPAAFRSSSGPALSRMTYRSELRHPDLFSLEF